MRSSIEVRIWAGFGVALLLLLVLAVSAYRGTRAGVESARVVEHSDQVNAGLDNLRLVSDTTDAIKQIHTSCRQQDGATGQIAAAMNQINAGMKQTAAAVEQTAASARVLTETATELQDMVVR